MKRREFVKTMTAVGAGLLLRPSSPFLLDAQEAMPDPAVKRVLVMFKCHFDAGFIDTQYNVVHKYFNQYFPQAIEIARAANAGGKRRFVWSTGSWLLYEYLDHAAHAERKTMEDAIARGDIAWHALPFTWWSEILNQSLMEGGIGISEALDRRFGVVTCGAKMTDVPGHTRGLVTALAKHGVKFLDIGLNPVPAVPAVPQLFLWKDPSGASVPVAYHRDYGGSVKVPGSGLVVAACVRGDNSGPHTAAEIAKVHAEYAARFPNAEIVACNLSDIAVAIEPYRDKLPVVTGEIGDTWIYGPPSDPLKLARYRAVAKMLDVKGYKVGAFSWEEKRKDLLDGVATLPAKLRAQADAEIKGLNAVEPKVGAAATAHPAGVPIETAHYTLAIDGKTGALIRLRNKATGREWASATNPIGLFTYQTLSQEDYTRYLADYSQCHDEWVAHDFGKPNIEKFGAVSRDWHSLSSSCRKTKP